MRWVGFGRSSVAVPLIAATLILSTLILLVFGAFRVANASDVVSGGAVGGTPINREILGLYDGATEPMVEFSRLHKYLEMPLNHLGYKLTLLDISKGLPLPADAQRYRAVATWFSGRVTNAEAYLAWAAQLARGGTRFVVLDSVGMIGSADELSAVNGFLSELGIIQAPYYVGDSKETRLERLDAVVNGEAKLDPAALPPHTVFVATKSTVKPSATVHLSVTDPAHRWVKAPAAALVATSTHGGFVASGFAMRYDPTSQRVQWIIDPFRFLEAALGQSRAPVPDTTTVSGRRLYFSHIDGDGWNNATEVQPYGHQGQRAATVMLDQLIVPYPDLPVTVGLIAGDVNPADGGDNSGTAVAKAIFALPQVEVASHTHTHPFHWTHFQGYSRDREISTILATLETKPPLEDRSLKGLVDKWRAAARLEPVTQASAIPVSADLPRARPHQPFDLDREVKGALDVSTSLAPEGKRARMYLWSGDCRPFEDVLKATRQAGMRNLNGGDSRFDVLHPSQAYVPPLSRMVGAERQIYAVNSNENTYTNGWTGPFDAFRMLGETLDNTELPRRLKGFNVYYHSFSATKPEGVAAVRGNLDKARAANVAPITASRYADIAEGFFTTKIVQTGRNTWLIRDRGGLQTMRFDAADGLSIDYAGSVGIVGDNRHAGSLYVTLDPAVAEPVIAVRPAAAKPVSAKATARLTESRWTLSAVERRRCSVAADAQGFGAGDMTWEGLTPGAHTVTLLRHGVVVMTRRVLADTTGHLSARLATSAIEPLQLRITCAPGLASARPSTSESGAAPAEQPRPLVRP